ncbi:MAG: methyltransferase [Anaerolineae bacterium]|nr:methyltransferase [Anaerolineae bacterium]
MPLTLNPLERFFLLTLNQGPATMLDMYGGPATRTVLAGIRLNVFEALAEQSATAEELAQRLNLDARGASILLETLASLGYVRKRGAQFHLTAMTRKWLTDAGTTNFSPFYRFWGAMLENLFPRLEDAIRTGAPPLNLYEWLETHPDVSRDFQAGLMAGARLFQDGVANLIPMPPSARRVLDIGGGHALYSVALCQKYPQLSAVVLDSADALVVGRETIRAAQLNERIEPREGDFVRDELGTGFDIALLFNILHGFRAEQDIALLKKARTALNPGGRVVIMDQLVGSSPTPIVETFAQIFSMSFFLLVGGQAYTFEEMRGWLTQAGYGNIELKRSLKAGGLLLLAQNPG